MERIEGGEASDKVFDFTGYGVAVRTPKFDFGVSIFLGEGGDVIGTKMKIAAEDDGCPECVCVISFCFAYVCV